MRRRNKYILIGGAVTAVLLVCVLCAVIALTGGKGTDDVPDDGTAGQAQQIPQESGDPSGSYSGDEPQEPVTQPTVTGPAATDPSGAEPGSSEPATEPTEAPEPSIPAVEEKLEILQWGRYSGEYVEDGSDEQVQNVAVILVRNNTADYLSYAQLVMDIDGQAARFVVMGLPPGECAWVLEKTRMEIASDAEFIYVDSAVGFQSAVDQDALPLTVTGGSGQITLTNTGDETLSDVYVYYKVRHTDGNFLGGILYRKGLGDLAPGETVSGLAGHFDPDKAEIVRITINDE